jgi:hypothetical protein
MRQVIAGDHFTDQAGNPAGGYSNGEGITIRWQVGPLGRGADRKPPNGAFVEGVIEAAADRLRWYQQTKFACQENALALAALESALDILDSRTRDREGRQVEGTHAV